MQVALSFLSKKPYLKKKIHHYIHDFNSNNILEFLVEQGIEAYEPGALESSIALKVSYISSTEGMPPNITFF